MQELFVNEEPAQCAQQQEQGAQQAQQDGQDKGAVGKGALIR